MKAKAVLRELFTASTWSLCIGSIVGYHVCFISCYSPFFHIWPVATSVSVQRFPLLDTTICLGKTTLWCFSPILSGMIPSQREAYCSEAFVVWLLFCRMEGGLPSAWVFLELCVNSRELRIGCNTRARVWESFCILLSCDQKKKRMCSETRRPTLEELLLCCIKVDENAHRGKAGLIQTDPWRKFQLKFHGVFSRLTVPDWAEAQQLETALVWTLVGRWSVSKGLSWGHLKVPDLPG